MRVVIGVLVVCSGCAVFNKAPFDPPARLTVGAATRRFDAPIENKGNAGQAAFRQTQQPTAPALTVPHESMLATVGFTMASRWGTYAGGEIETGVLDTPGSSAAGMYGVFGLRGAVSRAYFGAEVAGGYRTVRYSLDTSSEGKFVAEPRVRADFWLAPQFTIGGSAGVTLGDQSVWMAGIHLGIHSTDFGRGRR